MSLYVHTYTHAAIHIPIYPYTHLSRQTEMDGRTDRQTDRQIVYVHLMYAMSMMLRTKTYRFKLHAIMYTSPEFLGLGQKLQDLIF